MKIYPKKSLGQNFLIDRNIIEKIVSTTKIYNKDILEVGPGTGNLKGRINIINKDILKTDETKISKNLLIVFGNLPYNISTEILLRWIQNLNSNFWFKELILMFQKEVAERLIAKMGTSNYGRLSIISQWKLNIKRITNVKSNCFYPKPKIESTLLHFFPKKNFAKLDCRNLELITRVFFNYRRKMIKKPLSQLFKDPTLISKKYNISLDLRPQNLAPEIYYELAKNYKKLRG